MPFMLNTSLSEVCRQPTGIRCSNLLSSLLFFSNGFCVLIPHGWWKLKRYYLCAHGQDFDFSISSICTRYGSGDEPIEVKFPFDDLRWYFDSFTKNVRQMTGTLTNI